MARRNTQNKTTAPAVEETAPEVTEETVAEATAPANIEIKSQDEEPVAAPAAAAPEQIQTDFRDKLLNREVDNNIFVPSNPAALEKAASAIAEEKGFDLNRGTSIGARLMARANKSI